MSKGPLGLPEKDRGGVFFLYGDDGFRKEEEARALVDWHLDPATGDFNFDSLRGSEVSIETLASVLATPPMMAEWRVVILREAEALASSARAREVLLRTASAPAPGLALIILASIPDRSEAKVYKELKRRTRSFEFKAIDPNDVPGWLMERAAARYGRELTEEAARALAAGVGTDLGVLVLEVEKLLDAVEEGAPIDVDAVRRTGTRIPVEDRWEWMDKVGRRELKEAARGLRTLLAQGETAVGLTIGLTTHLIRLGIARTRGAATLESLLPYRQRWLVKRLVPQARRWTVEELEEALLGLRRADRLLKSSQLSEEHVLEEWLLTLMARAQEGATSR